VHCGVWVRLGPPSGDILPRVRDTRSRFPHVRFPIVDAQGPQVVQGPALRGDCGLLTLNGISRYLRTAPGAWWHLCHGAELNGPGPGQVSLINQIEGMPCMSIITKGNNAFHGSSGPSVGAVPPVKRAIRRTLSCSFWRRLAHTGPTAAHRPGITSIAFVYAFSRGPLSPSASRSNPSCPLLNKLGV
jgi:hypothetical protein